MANFDGGHYFLTMLAPIRRGVLTDVDGADRSPQQILRQILGTLPVAQQDAPSLASGLNSPFAAVPGTHFVRFFIIDELRFNGRRPSNPIIDLFTGVDMLAPETVDDLIDPYLVLTVDFDAKTGDDAELRAYTDALWRRAEPTLRLIFDNCMGFDAVKDATSFYLYVKKCQVKTTMPFTDYWTVPMPRWALPGLVGKALAGVGALALAVAFSGLWPWGPVRLILATIAVALVICLWLTIKVGTAIWPKAPHSDLQSVLKALYTQQAFVDFATRHQGMSDQDLHEAFGRFCQTHRPDDLKSPTQKPGALTSKEHLA